MTVEGAVVKNHLAAPTHAVENGTRAGNRTDRKARAESFAEGANVELEAVVFLAAPGRVAEAGDHFVKDEERAMVVCKFSDALEISVARRNAAHVGHDG